MELTASDGVRLVSWAMPAEQRIGLLAADLPRQRRQHLRGRAAVPLRGPPGAGAEPVRLRLPRIRRERRRADGARASTATPTPPTATSATRWAFPPSGSSSSAIRSARRWRSSWWAGRPAAGLMLDGALTSVVERAQEVFPYAPVRWIAASRYPSIERVGVAHPPEAVPARPRGRGDPLRPRPAAVRGGGAAQGVRPAPGRARRRLRGGLGGVLRGDRQVRGGTRRGGPTP